MKQILQLLIVVTIQVWTTYGLYAQQGFVAFGGEAAGSGGNMSISGGRIDFEYYSSSQGSLSLGLQHSWNEIAGIPPILAVPNTTVSLGQSLCYNATQTVILAGDGKHFTVQNGGHADIIAGQNIFLKPGTMVFPGGSLHAYISTEWCDNLRSLVAITEEISNQEIQNFESQENNSFFTVYPNPTSGNLTIELMNSKEFSDIQIEVFSAQGNLVLENRMPAAKQYNLSFSGMKPGIYLIRVLSDNDTGIKKIIKN